MSWGNETARSASAFFRSRFGNLELAITKGPRAPAGRGDVHHLVRDDLAQTGWRYVREITRDDAVGVQRHPGEVPLDRVFRFPCWTEGTDGNFHGVVIQGGYLKWFSLPPDHRWLLAPNSIYVSDRYDTRIANQVTREPNVIGAPGFVQGLYGAIGNFEAIVPVATGGMEHWAADTSDGLPHKTSTGEVRYEPVWFRVATFGRHRVLAARLIHSDFGNLEVIALEQESNETSRLVHYFQGPQREWQRGTVLAGSERAVGIPGFIQSSFESVSGNGNLEVVAPSAAGGFLRWYRGGIDEEFVQRPPIDPHGSRYVAAHLTQSSYTEAGTPHGNFEVVAEVAASLYGTGAVMHYWRDSATGTWHGPLPVNVSI